MVRWACSRGPRSSLALLPSGLVAGHHKPSRGLPAMSGWRGRLAFARARPWAVAPHPGRGPLLRTPAVGRCSAPRPWAVAPHPGRGRSAPDISYYWWLRRASVVGQTAPAGFRWLRCVWWLRFASGGPRALGASGRVGLHWPGSFRVVVGVGFVCLAARAGRTIKIEARPDVQKSITCAKSLLRPPENNDLAHVIILEASHRGFCRDISGGTNSEDRFCFSITDSMSRRRGFKLGYVPRGPARERIRSPSHVPVGLGMAPEISSPTRITQRASQRRVAAGRRCRRATR
ncbi:hypothetical protein J2S43_004348 [Catenuloplanes nepalensis]|uniref:Uncharacterized protein n=1 Tax=Catenuloplanes nepalensis TaxID=587533 RepID=A0ABT9MWL8_9ACTN|nr:hypothetical protein [Catenuloplanes nepalensis]